ncbi:hypothetical protein C2S52_021418 [Perilla frutescens var. hirtella]|nr:hypothetical protein C2S52_021418 [Perilla frutescens var. hirtella]KAH6808350.1 hypothetical protein C2S51_029458 [Perilla frutescens var. frutescens]
MKKMEIEKGAPEIGQKLWNIVRIMFYMMRRSKAKTKIMVELNMLVKKGKNAGKAISNLILHHHHHHYSALTCRSNDVTASFISPREYEFSCSNTPLYKRRNHHHHHNYQAEELKLMHKVFGILSRYDMVEASPPAATQPFSAADSDDQLQLQVDKDAEEFIKKFYRELKKQKPLAALESPSPYREWAS